MFWKVSILFFLMTCTVQSISLHVENGLLMAIFFSNYFCCKTIVCLLQYLCSPTEVQKSNRKQARKVQLEPNLRTNMGFTSPGEQVAHSTSSVHFVEQVKHFTHLTLTVIFKSTKTMIQLASKAG